MRQVVTVILRLGVVPQKDLDVTPRALYCVGVGARVWIFEVQVCLTVLCL